MPAKNANISNFSHTRRRPAVWGTNAGVTGRGRGIASVFKQKRSNKRFDARRPNVWGVNTPTPLSIGATVAAPPVNHREGEEGYDMHRRHRIEQFYSSESREIRREAAWMRRTQQGQERRNRVQWTMRNQHIPGPSAERVRGEHPTADTTRTKHHKRQQGAYVAGGRFAGFFD